MFTPGSKPDNKASNSGARRAGWSEAFRRERSGEPGGANGEDGEASLKKPNYTRLCKCSKGNRRPRLPFPSLRIIVSYAQSSPRLAWLPILNHALYVRDSCCRFRGADVQPSASGSSATPVRIPVFVLLRVSQYPSYQWIVEQEKLKSAIVINAYLRSNRVATERPCLPSFRCTSFRRKLGQPLLFGKSRACEW